MGDDGIVMDSLRRLVRALRAASLSGDKRVTAAQLFMLKAIAARPRQSLAEVSELTLTRQSSASEVVARLLIAGLVTREVDAADHRRAQLSLTPNGERIVATASDTPQERLIAGFRSLPARQRRALAGGMQAWITAAGLEATPATMFLEPN